MEAWNITDLERFLTQLWRRHTQVQVIRLSVRLGDAIEVSVPTRDEIQDRLVRA